MLLEAARGALEAAIEEADFHPGDRRYDVERMRLLLQMTELAQTLLRLLIALRVPNPFEGFVDWTRKVRNFLRLSGAAR